MLVPRFSIRLFEILAVRVEAVRNELLWRVPLVRVIMRTVNRKDKMLALQEVIVSKFAILENLVDVSIETGWVVPHTLVDNPVKELKISLSRKLVS